MFSEVHLSAWRWWFRKQVSDSWTTLRSWVWFTQNEWMNQMSCLNAVSHSDKWINVMEWITWTLKRWNRRMMWSDENESSSAVSESLALWIFICWIWMCFSQGSWSCCPNDLMLLIHWINLSVNRLTSFTQTSLWSLTWRWWREFAFILSFSTLIYSHSSSNVMHMITWDIKHWSILQSKCVAFVLYIIYQFNNSWSFRHLHLFIQSFILFYYVLDYCY